MNVRKRLVRERAAEMREGGSESYQNVLYIRMKLSKINLLLDFMKIANAQN